MIHPAPDEHDSDRHNIASTRELFYNGHIGKTHTCVSRTFGKRVLKIEMMDNVDMDDLGGGYTNDLDSYSSLATFTTTSQKTSDSLDKHIQNEKELIRPRRLCLRRELPCSKVVQFCLRRKLPVPGTKGQGGRRSRK